MQFGVSYEGRESPQILRDLACAADQAGAVTLWAASHLFQREPIVNVAMVLANTAKLSAGLMAMSPLTMHPVHIAMAAAALDEWFPGRVTLCLGVGAPRDLAAIGLEANKPLQAIRESIAIARAVLSGDVVQVNGERYRAHGRRLESGPHNIPIVLAASGPKMLELAGAEADGVLISAATSPAFIAQALDHVASGEAKTRRRIRRAALVYAAVSPDGRQARNQLRRNLGFVLRGAHHAPNLAMAGTRLDQAALNQAIACGAWETVDRLVDDTVLDNHSASGTPEQVTAALRAYGSIGLDEIVLSGVPDGAALRHLLQVATESAKT
jgi:5,10-methylenetetrahydromethanopterin reductase